MLAEGRARSEGLGVSVQGKLSASESGTLTRTRMLLGLDRTLAGNRDGSNSNSP